MKTKEAIHKTVETEEDYYQTLRMIEEEEREDILEAEAVIIPSLRAGDSPVVFVNDGYNTMIDIACGGNWKTLFVFSTFTVSMWVYFNSTDKGLWDWIEHALKTIYSAGYKVDEVDKILDMCDLDMCDVVPDGRC